MNEVRIGVDGIESFFENARRMARELDHGRVSAEPAQVSFSTMELLLKTLTPNRWALLRILRRTGPHSVRALAGKLGRDYRGVHSDVSALREAGLIERREDGLVEVPWSKISVEMSLHDAV